MQIHWFPLCVSISDRNNTDWKQKTDYSTFMKLKSSTFYWIWFCLDNCRLLPRNIGRNALFFCCLVNPLMSLIVYLYQKLKGMEKWINSYGKNLNFHLQRSFWVERFYGFEYSTVVENSWTVLKQKNRTQNGSGKKNKFLNIHGTQFLLNPFFIMANRNIL